MMNSRQKSGSEADQNFSQGAQPVNLSQWNPMLDAYSSKAFNSYFKPTLTADYLEKYQSLEGSGAPPESFSPTKGDSKEITLYLNNIPLSLTKEGLKNFLSQAAPVQSVRICQSKDPERGTTFGFVTVEASKDAENIIKHFNNYSFGTRSNLHIKLALSTEERDRRRDLQKEEEDYYLKLYKDVEVPSQEDLRSSIIRDLSSTMEEVSNVKKPGAMKKDDRVCIGCSNHGNKQCGRCKACYCSVECQRSHWSQHQKDCLQVKATTPEVKPVSNGYVTKSVSKSDHFDESSFMLTVDGIDLNENKFHNMKDLKSPTPLDTNIRVMVYVVEGLVIKGQVICDNDTRAFVSMSERLNSYFSEEPEFLKKEDCREGMLVIVSYAGEICRAVVMRYSIGAEDAEVYFIDYGNQENCKVAAFKPLPSFAVDLPSMCREFTLSELPTDLQPSVELSLSDHLKTLVLEKLVEAETRVLPGGSYEMINTTEDGVKVNDAMLALYQELSAKSIHSTNGDKASGNQAVANTNVENIVIPFEPLPNEQDFRIVVTDIKSPSSFFAQIIAADLSNITQLANLSEQLQNQPLSGASSFNASAGQVCVAFFPEDEMWYRASIDQVNADGSVKVSYFDYGNTVDLERSFLKPISSEFTTLPRQARKFALHNVQSTTGDGRWSDDAVALFKEKVSAEPCEVFCMAIVDDICHVQLYLPTDDICADQLLIDNGFAKSGSQAEPSLQSQVPVAESQVPVARPAENPAATADAVPVSIPTVAPVSIPTAAPISIKQMQLKRIEVKPDEVLHVVVVHVIDPYCFYVNIANRENIETLMEYGVLLHEKSLVQLQDPQPGDICCALYTDGDWYRAKVISSSKNTSFVSFCDYGNDSEVPNSSLKIIPDEVTTLPAQAVKVKLSCVSPILENSPWSETAKEYFAGLICDKLFDMKVESVNGEVIAAALSSVEVKDVAEELINAGLALSSIQSLSSQKEKQICNNVPAQTKPTQLEVIETELVNPVVADQPKPVMKDEQKQILREEPKQIVKEELKPVPRDLQEQALIEQPKPVYVDQQKPDVTPVVSDEQKQASPKGQGPNKPPLDQTPQIGTADEEKVQRNNNASLDKGLPDSKKEASASKNAKKERAKNVDSSPDMFNGSNEGRGVNNNFHQKRGSRGFARGRGRGYGNHFQNRDQPINSHKQAYTQQDMYGNYPYGPHMYPFPYPFMYPPNMGYFPPPLPGMPHPFQFDQNQPMNGKQDRQDPRSQEVSPKPAEGDMSLDSHSKSSNNVTSPRGGGVFRGRGGRGGRGGTNNPQNGFNKSPFKQRPKLPQEKIPSEYFSGAEISFIVTNVESPSCFYIQDEKLRGEDKLTKADYEQAPAVSSIAGGLLCAALIGGCFYRAVVQKVYQDKVSVRLADSGRNEFVNKSSLKRLMPHDFKRPFHACKCLLHNAKGPGATRWSNEAVKYFAHKIHAANGKLHGVVRGELPSGLMIDLRDPENDEAFVTDDLVKQGFAYYFNSGGK